MQLIAPIMGMADVTLLGIGTPGDDRHHYYQLMQAKDKAGKPICKAVSTQLPCKRCRMFNRSRDCRHNQNSLPAWKSNERLEMLKDIMPDPDLFARENMGVMATGKLYYFDRASVDSLFSRPPYFLTRNPDILYVAIDPSGGGAMSDYAMVTAVCEGDNWIVRTFSLSSSSSSSSSSIYARERMSLLIRTTNSWRSLNMRSVQFLAVVLLTPTPHIIPFQ